MTTLLAHLATKTRAEDFATDALAYILSQPFIRSALTEYVRTIRLDFPDILSVSTRASTEGLGIPDITVQTTDGPLLTIENKFWAGLTKHQPVSYMKALPDTGIVLFLVPHLNVDYVWSLLLDRMKGHLEIIGNPKVDGTKLKFQNFFGNKTLAITSWHELLNFLELRATNGAQKEVSADIAQLQGLCNSIDEQFAFVPFTSYDLSDKEVARKILDILSVTDEVLRTGEHRKIFKRDRSKPDSVTYSGDDITFPGDVEAWFGVWYNAWVQFGHSPLWLQFNKPYLDATTIRRLNELQARNTDLIFETQQDFLIPISITADAQRADVLEGILARLCQIGGLVATT